MRDSRKTVIIVFLILSALVMMLTVLTAADEGMKIKARAAVLYEPTSETFAYQKNDTERLPMASTTKIMTGLIAVEELNPNEIICVPPDAVGIEGSSLYMKAGDTILASDLIYSLLLQSANDAATLLAMKISGDVASFAEKMNARAEKLGLKDTHFDNPHGLDSKAHYTSARDLALLTANALSNETFRKIVSTYKHTFMIGDKVRTVVNHNKLLRRYDGCIGVKTGFTDESGRCLVSAAEKDGVLLIAVTLDCGDDWNEHEKMLDYGFDHFKSVRIKDLCKIEREIPIVNSDTPLRVGLDIKKDSITVGTDDDIRLDLVLRQYIVAPIKKGDKVGEVIIYKNNVEVDRLDYLALETVNTRKNNIFDFLFRR